MKIGIKLYVVIMMVTVIALLISSSLFIIKGSESIKERYKEQLRSVSVLKENQLNSFFDRGKSEIEEFALEKGIVDHLILVNGTSVHGEGFGSHEAAHELLMQKVKYSYFTEIFLLTPGGEVHMSSDHEQEGKIKTDEYFIRGKNGTYIQSFYYDISLQQPAITVATPVLRDGILVGVLAGRLDMHRVSTIMTERSGLGNTGETYLVNKFNYLLTDSRFIPDIALKQTVHTDAVVDCLRGNSDSLEYLDYRGEPVLGHYSWDPDQQVCLIAEIDTLEAYAPIHALQRSVVIVTLVVVILIVFLSIVLAEGIVAPLHRLRDVAVKIDRGDLDAQITVETKDEIGELAKAFADLTSHLRLSKQESDNLVKQRTHELDIQVNELKDNKRAMINMMEDLQESLEKQKRLEQVKTEFLSVTSHELRTPITPMRAQLQMILQGYMGKVNKEQEKSLNLVLSNTTRLDQLIGDILDISKLQSGVMKFILARADLSTVIREAVNTMRPKAQTKGIRIIFSSSRTRSVLIDKNRIIQVVVNLINNAIKFTDKGGTITVRLDDMKTLAKVSISDTGIGISAEDLIRIFRPFEQVDSSRGRNYEGTGLGLSICKGIVIQHGGEIWVESVPGKGSTFIFTIPYKQRVKPGEADVELFRFDKATMLKNLNVAAAEEGYRTNDAYIDEMFRKGLISEQGRLAHGVSFSDLETAGYITRPNSGRSGKQSRKTRGGR